MGNKTDPRGGSVFNIGIVFLHALERHMGNKTDPMGGSIFIISYCFLHALERCMGNFNWAQGGLGIQHLNCVELFLHALGWHMDNNADPLGGSLFNINIVFYIHLGWQNLPHTRIDIQHLYCFLHALKRHEGNKTDPMGGSIFNICIVFYVQLNDVRGTKLKPWEDTQWNDICVTKLTPREDLYSACVLIFAQYSTSVLFSTCIGTTYR